MHGNILIATDGSSLSAHTVEYGSNLAKSLGARILLLTVTDRFHVFTLEADQIEETSTAPPLENPGPRCAAMKPDPNPEWN
jgi:nucleotide-binding universal stress UspA family protein